MEMLKIILTRGIQGSGKSTFAKQWCHEDPEHRVRFNNDDIRNMLGDYWVTSREKIVTAIKKDFLVNAMHNGYNIIIDNMNLNPKEIKFYSDIISSYNNCDDFKYKYELEFKDFWTPVEVCIERDSRREHPIGESVIKATWKRYRNFIICEDIKAMKKNSAKFIDGAKSAFIVDMDATLCLNTSGRPFYGDGAVEGMENDEDITSICELVKSFSKNHLLFIVTGREGTPEIVEATKNWLEKHNIVPFKMLFRPSGDYTAGDLCKKQIYEDNIKGKYNVEFVIDDSTKCVKMWREQGLICLQPNEGKF